METNCIWFEAVVPAECNYDVHDNEVLAMFLAPKE